MAYIGTSPANGVRRKHTYTATAGQTSFSGADDNNVTLTYVDTEYLDVYQNGVKLVAVSDYASTTGTSVVLTQGASVSDIIEIIVFDVFSVADTVSAGSGGSFGGNIGIGGTLSVTGGIVSPVTINGTTPTLTIGDAGAEDTKIVFDGNAQDYHIGLDDSTDSLTIGLGSALGTTSHIVINASGEVTKPLQPSFLVNKGGTAQSNFSRNADVVVTFGTEVFDVGANFASNTFTAPVTGKYVLNAKIRMSEIDSAATYYAILIVTSNRNYSSIYDPRGYDQDPVNFSFNESAIVDMDANDTAKVQVYQAVGTDEHTSISGSAAYTNFGGYLLG